MTDPILPHINQRRARRRAALGWWLALAACAGALALAGCASPAGPDGAASSAPVAAAAPRIAVPPTSVGTWFDLGEHLAPWLAGDAPVPAAGPSVPTRVAGLQREDGRWLALVIVQETPGSAPCPLPTSLSVTQDGARGCLRLRRNADFDRWLVQEHPVLDRWIDEHGWGAHPRAWVGDRLATTTGTLETHALLDPGLIEPTTRNNSDFLAGGRAGLAWARQFANASAAAAGGAMLNVPPFPYVPAVAPPAAPAPVVTAPAPTRATQVEPPTPSRQQPAPRADRQ